MKRRFSEFFTQDVAIKSCVISKEGGGDPLITGLEYDSRNVKEGNLFFAMHGLHTDGSLFIDDAISKGAKVIVHQIDIGDDFKKDNDIVYIRVHDSRFAMSPISAAFYNYPSSRLLVTGVTGTEGKSTTVYFIWQMLTMLGKKAGFFSTAQQCFGADVLRNSEHQTTPEAPVVQRFLREMADNGCEYAVVESSSHGLSKITNRLGDVDFCSAVLTTLTSDHLEFHGTWEQYREDKANLFRSLDNYVPSFDLESNNKHWSAYTEAFGVINGDDRNARFFAKATSCKTFTFSSSGRDGDIVLEAIKSNSYGNWYTVFFPALKERMELRDRLPGAFNANNVLAALLVVSNLLKLPVREIAPLVKKLKPVRGRMTTILKGQNFEVVVDYAHTPSSYQAIFPSLHERLMNKGGRIISVFGSAGERDTQKRPEQGKIAANYSDIIVITDEDPRGEDPMSIIEEVAAGVAESERQDCFIRNETLFLIPDRPAAIRKALSLAEEKDLVIILGKGHENSIIYADRVMPYDEITEVEKALGEMGYR